MFLMSEVPLQTVQPPLFSAATGPLAETGHLNDSGNIIIHCLDSNRDLARDIRAKRTPTVA